MSFVFRCIFSGYNLPEDMPERFRYAPALYPHPGVSEAETVLQKKIMDFLETLDEKGVQIISKDVKIETKCAGWTAHGELLLREAAVSLVDSRAEDTGAEDLDRNED